MGNVRDELRSLSLELKSLVTRDHVVTANLSRGDGSSTMLILDGHDARPLEWEAQGPYETFVWPRVPGARLVVQFDGTLHRAQFNINGAILELVQKR